MSKMEYYETHADGEPKEPKLQLLYRDWRAILPFRFPGRMKQLEHFVALAAANPGTPVDVTHWTGEGDNRTLSYSARLTYIADEKPRIFLGSKLL